MLVEPLLTSFKHLVLQVEISDMLGSLFHFECGSLLLLLVHLFLDLFQLHPSVLLLDLPLMVSSHFIDLAVSFQSVNRVNFRLVFHDFSLLIGNVRRCLIF